MEVFEWVIIGGVIAVSGYLILKGLHTITIKDDALSKVCRSIDLRLSQTLAIQSKNLYLWYKNPDAFVRAGVIIGSVVFTCKTKEGKEENFVMFNVKTNPLYMGLFEILNNIFHIRRKFNYFVFKFDKNLTYNSEITTIITEQLSSFNALDFTYHFPIELHSIVQALISNEFEDQRLCLMFDTVMKNEIATMKAQAGKEISLTKNSEI